MATLFQFKTQWRIIIFLPPSSIQTDRAVAILLFDSLFVTNPWGKPQVLWATGGWEDLKCHFYSQCFYKEKSQVHQFSKPCAIERFIHSNRVPCLEYQAQYLREAVIKPTAHLLNLHCHQSFLSLRALRTKMCITSLFYLWSKKWNCEWHGSRHQLSNPRINSRLFQPGRQYLDDGPHDSCTHLKGCLT